MKKLSGNEMLHGEAQHRTGCRLCARNLMSAAMKCGLCTLFGAAPLLLVSKRSIQGKSLANHVTSNLLCSLTTPDSTGLFYDSAAYWEVLSIHILSMSQPISLGAAGCNFCSQGIASISIRSTPQIKGNLKDLQWLLGRSRLWVFDKDAFS